jgi:hypothetical protein
MQFESRIAGIPCIIDATIVSITKGEGYSAPSEIDARGSIEAHFEVLDRRGRSAPWLSRKMTDKIEAQIYSEIAEMA